MIKFFFAIELYYILFADHGNSRLILKEMHFASKLVFVIAPFKLIYQNSIGESFLMASTQTIIIAKQV